jgi:hypothetical protein
MRLLVCVVLPLLVACGSSTGATPPVQQCDGKCQDETALRAMREMIKLAYNTTLQGKPVGDHDETVPCPQGGSARVVGHAESNAIQGATFVSLTFTFTHCSYLQRDNEPSQNYQMTLDGTITEDGTIAVQPSATTSLRLKSDSLSFSGTVWDPPIDYAAPACAVVAGQDGSHVSGTICGREAGITL